MFLRTCLMAVSALGFGFLSSAGVFTVFVTVGIVPRFADKTQTAFANLTYESWIVFGAICGCLLSVYEDFFVSGGGRGFLEYVSTVLPFAGTVLLLLFGGMAGIFVGCIAIAIAEMLNTLPIFTRRAALGKGIGIVLLAIAFGKTVGSLIYFSGGMF
ncbi:MAG: stage V sporulation protein AB [Lachnospiraceae bacterium]|nr:stage V sporulation protein AB [Lachnospiraceae bacterium]